MNDTLEIALILNSKKISKIYNASIWILIIILITIYILFTYKIQPYYDFKGIINDNKLEVSVNLKELEIIKNNNHLLISNQVYQYEILSLSNELYIDDYHQYIYLKVEKIPNINNYLYEFRIPGKSQTLAKYIYEYIKEE